MAAAEGQKIEINIIDLAMVDNDTTTDSIAYGHVVDNSENHNFRYSRNGGGFSVGEYTSVSSRITLVLGQADHSLIVSYHGRYYWL